MSSLLTRTTNNQASFSSIAGSNINLLSSTSIESRVLNLMFLGCCLHMFWVVQRRNPSTSSHLPHPLLPINQGSSAAQRKRSVWRRIEVCTYLGGTNMRRRRTGICGRLWVPHLPKDGRQNDQDAVSKSQPSFLAAEKKIMLIDIRL